MSPSPRAQQVLKDTPQEGHRYVLDCTNQDVVITHKHCMVQADPGEMQNASTWPVCQYCHSLGNDSNIVKSIVKVEVKVIAAKLLQCRFGMGASAQQLWEEVQKRDSFPATKECLLQLWRLSPPELQRQVRTMYGHVGSERLAEPMEDLIAMLVAPHLAPVHTSTSPALESVRTVASSLCKRQLAEVGDLSLKLVAKAQSGALQQRPLVQGLLLAALERAERDLRDVPSMRRFQRSCDRGRLCAPGSMF